MSSFITALSPGNKLDSLSSFAQDYVAVRRAFYDLLVFPHLEVIEVSSEKNMNLLALVTDGNNRSTSLSSIDTELAGKVISYNSAFSALVGSVNADILVATMQPVAKGYADHARAESELNQKFFAEFEDYITTVDKRIVDMAVSLKKIDDEITQQNAALASKDIISTLWTILKTLYKLASTPEESDVQITTILGVTMGTINGTFKNLWEDNFRLKKIISSLRGLRTRIDDLRTRFSTLSKCLKTVITSSRSLLDVWDDVAERMVTVSGKDEVVPPHDVERLIKDWNGVAADARLYIETLQKPTSNLPHKASEAHRTLSARFNAIPKVPITGAEIALHKLAAQHDREPLYSCLALESDGNVSPSENDENVVKEVLGPCADTLQELDKLANDTGRIIDQFNTMLAQPFLDQYKCKSPIDGSDSDLKTVMGSYRTKYLKLQQDTIPIANDLCAYAKLQMALLPKVVPDEQTTDPEKLPMKSFLETNIPVVKQYHEKVASLSARSTEMKNDWDNVTIEINKLIAQCDHNISTMTNSINDITKEEKKMKMHFFLKKLGAFLAFAPTAFAPVVGILCAFALSDWLGKIEVEEAIATEKMTVAKNTLQGAINNEQKIKDRLQELLPFCEAISASLSSVSLIWAKILTSLNTVNNFYSILEGATGPIVLDKLKPTLIQDWTAIENGVNKYIEVVSK